MTKDMLSWELFFEGAKKRKNFPPDKVDPFNRLIAYTKNYFAIIGYGPFTLGYVIVITKKLVPAFSYIKDEQLDELRWFINTLSSIIVKTYNRKIVVFEHGMCACVGGLDRAHIHIMTIDKSITSSDVKNSIDEVLEIRKSGIRSVVVDGITLENTHDIQQIMSASEKHRFKINGEQLNFNKIKNDLNFKLWPMSTRQHVSNGGHYVYFNSGFDESSFLTNRNFNTQLGREIVFNLEIKKNGELNKIYEEKKKDNPYINMWKWQEFGFYNGILQTMGDLKKELKNADLLEHAKKFEYSSMV